MQTRYKLREVQNNDIEWLLELRMQTMSEHILASGTRPTRENQINRIDIDFDSIMIVTFDDRDIGMIKLLKTPTYWKLIQIQLLSEFQNRGIGCDLIENVQSDACNLGIPVFLSVLKGNPAKRLYERLGFRTYCEKEKSYEMSYTI